MKPILDELDAKREQARAGGAQNGLIVSMKSIS